MLKHVGMLMAALPAVAVIYGCSHQATQNTSAAEEKDFAITPASVHVQAGPVTGELSQLKISEEVSEKSGVAVSSPQLTGHLELKNTSTDRIVHMISGKIRYLDDQGHPLKFGDGKTETHIPVASYDSTQLNPGQSTSQSVTAGFPGSALKKKTVKDISLELSYDTAPYQDRTLNFDVAIGSK